MNPSRLRLSRLVPSPQPQRVADANGSPPVVRPRVQLAGGPPSPSGAGWRRLLQPLPAAGVLLTLVALLGYWGVYAASTKRTPVLLATHALPAGTVLSASDVRTGKLAGEGSVLAALVPESERSQVIGQRLSTAVPAGAPLPAGALAGHQAQTSAFVLSIPEFDVTGAQLQAGDARHRARHLRRWAQARQLRVRSPATSKSSLSANHRPTRTRAPRRSRSASRLATPRGVRARAGERGRQARSPARRVRRVHRRRSRPRPKELAMTRPRVVLALTPLTEREIEPLLFDPSDAPLDTARQRGRGRRTGACCKGAATSRCGPPLPGAFRAHAGSLRARARHGHTPRRARARSARARTARHAGGRCQPRQHRLPRGAAERHQRRRHGRRESPCRGATRHAGSRAPRRPRRERLGGHRREGRPRLQASARHRSPRSPRAAGPRCSSRPTRSAAASHSAWAPTPATGRSSASSERHRPATARCASSWSAGHTSPRVGRRFSSARPTHAR